MALGSGTRDFAVGDRVAYFRSQGAYASERLIDESLLVKIPDEIEFDEAATLMVKGIMAWLSAKKLFTVEPGQTVLVTTAAGGIGSLVTRMAAWRGARVIGVVGSEAKRAAALANGAVDVAIGLSDGLALALDATSGTGVDAVLDGIGAGVAEAAILSGAVKKGGAVVSFGSAGGWVTADAAAVANQGVTLFNPLASDYLRTPEELRANIREVFDLKLSGAFGELPITRYPLEKATQLHNDVEQRRLSGLAVLIP